MTPFDFEAAETTLSTEVNTYQLKYLDRYLMLIKMGRQV